MRLVGKTFFMFAIVLPSRILAMKCSAPEAEGQGDRELLCQLTTLRNFFRSLGLLKLLRLEWGLIKFE